MASENDALWNAMKMSKYRNTMRLLQEISMSDSASPETFLSEILNIVARAIHAEIGTLWYYAKYDDGRIRPKAQYGGDESITDFSLSLGEGVAGAVIETGEGDIILDCQKDRRWSGKVDSKTGRITRTMMCAPIKEEGFTFGCIQLINRTDGNLFDKEDFAFLEKLCIEISLLFNRQAKVFMMDRFAKLDTSNVSRFSTIETAEDIDSMLESVRSLPRFTQLDAAHAKAFEMHCTELWKMMHED